VAAVDPGVNGCIRSFRPAGAPKLIAPLRSPLRIDLLTEPTGGAMAERWFSDEELEQMSRPTMDRAIEALDCGDIDAARALCEEMKHEWRYLHDLMAEGIGGLISFVQERLGDEGVADACYRSGGGESDGR
jgi:hypothetical protein